MKALIAEQTVRDTEGREWKVGIRWLPRRPTWLGWGPGRKRSKRTRDGSWIDGLDPMHLPDEIPAALVVIGVILALVFARFVVLPLAVFALDLLFLLLVAAAGVATRVLFRRPWIVEATSEGDTRRPVVGFRSSKALVGEVSWALQNGRALEEL